MDAFSAYNKLPVIKQSYDTTWQPTSQVAIDAKAAGVIDWINPK